MICPYDNCLECSEYDKCFIKDKEEHIEVEFTQEELELIYDCLSSTKNRYDNLIFKIERLIY